MQKTPPSRAQLAAIVLFAFSCFAIVLYIWKTFGGPSPLAPHNYQVSADFNEASQLADGADVRISGVPVGHVTSTRLQTKRTRATLEIKPKYAPLARDTTAILRQKTLLGETYVELSPGVRSSGTIPDGGSIKGSNVKPTVELDEVTRAFDPRTRRDLQRLLGSLAVAVNGRGQSLNDALGQLGSFTDSTTQMLTILDEQHDAVRRVVRDSGVMFDALSRRQGELSGLIQSGDRVLATTARRDRDLADTVRILPTTLGELGPTLDAVRQVSTDAAPVVSELRPPARSLGPTLVNAAALAPDAQRLFADLDRVVSASRTALPAATRIVNAAHPVFRILVPTLQQALPVVQYLSIYKQELITAFAGLAASTQGAERAQGGGPPLHYIRALVPVTSEAAVAQSQRLGSNRHNPYLLPLGLLKLSGGLDSFDCQNTGNKSFGDTPPPCRVQQPLEFEGRRTSYPHVEPAK